MLLTGKSHKKNTITERWHYIITKKNPTTVVLLWNINSFHFFITHWYFFVHRDGELTWVEVPLLPLNISMYRCYILHFTSKISYTALIHLLHLLLKSILIRRVGGGALKQNADFKKSSLTCHSPEEIQVTFLIAPDLKLTYLAL